MGLSTTRKNIITKREINAISEIIGTILLLGIAVALFSVVYYTVLSENPPQDQVYASFHGEIIDNTIVITHYGGESIELENSQITGTLAGETITNFQLIDKNNNGKWDVGETIEYQDENIFDSEVSVTISEKQTNNLMFYGIIQEGEKLPGPVLLNTSVNQPATNIINNPIIGLSANGDSRLQSVELWYRYSEDNESWGGNETIGEIRIIRNVDSLWTHVDFWNSYVQPVIIAIYNLESESNAEACVRITNVESSGCDIRIQNPGNKKSVTPGDVHLLVIEHGSHFLNDGRKIEAFRYVEDDTSENNNWDEFGTLQSYLHSYTNPVVLGSVMSSNDSGWSVPYFTDGSRGNPPSSASLYTSKHVGEDIDIIRIPETIGYVVIEEGTGLCEDISYEARLGSNSIDGVANQGDSYDLSDDFSVGVATQGGMDGSDGSWAVLYGSDPVSTTLNVACEEDTIGDSDRGHITEQLNFWVFSKQGNITSNKSTGSGWIKWNKTNNPDTTHPWQWDFDFPQGPGYYEFYSIGRNETHNESHPYIADSRCQFIISSVIDSISPFIQTFSSLNINSTASASYDNVTLYYRYSDDNLTWQSASIQTAFLKGNSLDDGSMNLNSGTQKTLLFNDANIDSSFFNYSDAQPERLTVIQDGDYFISFTLPMQRIDTNGKRTCVQSDIYVNGVKNDGGISRSSYIRMASGHSESSNHQHVLLKDLVSGDYIEIKVKGITSMIDSSYPVIASQAFSLYAEYISSSEQVLSATGTETTYSTNLNQVTPYEMIWKEERKDVDFLHDDVANPENIILKNVGTYLVFVNIPLESSDQRANIKGKILLNGVPVAGGVFQQGYMRNLEDHSASSIHWAGVVVSSLDNGVLTVSVQRGANSGTVTVGGEKATLFVRKLSDENFLFTTASEVSSGGDWNPSSQAWIEWENDVYINNSLFSHSEVERPHEISVEEDGDYHLVYNGVFSITNQQRSNNKISIEINNVTVLGAESKTNYIRRANDHDEASTCLSILLQGLQAGDTIKLSTIQEADDPIVNDEVDSILFLWKKQTNRAQDWTIWDHATNPDNDSPWDWVFPFPYANCYYEFASIAMVNTHQEIFPENAETSCYYQNN